MWTTRAVMVVVMLLGSNARVLADTTTTTQCRQDWSGAVVCSTSEWSSSGGGGGGGPAKKTWPLTTFNSLAVVTAGLLLMGQLNGETIMGTAMIGEIGPAPVGYLLTDDEPPVEVKRRWKKKVSLRGHAWGGVVSVAGEAAPLAGGRLTLARGRVGLDGAYARAVDSDELFGSAEAHLLLRASPRMHIMNLALALGVRRVTLTDGPAPIVREGIDVGLPHDYVLFRDDDTGEPDVVLAMRPHFMVGDNGVDLRFDIGLVVPIASRLAVEVTGQAFSYDRDMFYGAALGLTSAL